MNVCADASIHHPGLVGASSMYLSHSPSKHANLEGSFLTDDKPTCQRLDFSAVKHRGLTTLADNGNAGAMNVMNMNERPLHEKKSRTVVPERIRWSYDCLVEGKALRSSYGNGAKHKQSTYFCMCRIFMVIALAVASVDMRVMMFADAAFAPRTRTELQGDGQGSTLGVFGCVGSCGGSLSRSGDSTYCGRGGSWGYGSGNPCNNAGSAVPSNQGTGTYGTMGSWDVSRVDNMGMSKFVPSTFYQCESF